MSLPRTKKESARDPVAQGYGVVTAPGTVRLERMQTLPR